VRKSKAPMLLIGQTGAGKSFLARRVCEKKKARHQMLRNAHKGLLFLDEIGELGPDEQAMCSRRRRRSAFCQWAAPMKCKGISS
jgi:sigma54-dependent transcription regulator